MFSTTSKIEAAGETPPFFVDGRTASIAGK
jgi:hypothetical protein